MAEGVSFPAFKHNRDIGDPWLSQGNSYRFEGSLKATTGVGQCRIFNSSVCYQIEQSRQRTIRRKAEI